MRILSIRSFLFVIAVLLLSATTCSCSREDDPEEQKKEKEDKKVEDWENEDINGDATMAPRMMFSLGDTIQVEGKVTTRATYTIVDEVEKCLLDENDIVTIEVSPGAGSTRSTAKKNYKVGSNHTNLTYYEGTPSLNEFHWNYGTEKINIRAWSYGGTVADNTTPITDPDGQVISIEQNQKENGYKELFYSPQQTDISFTTGKSGISLPLYHQMARVVVTLSKKASDDAATVSSVTIGDGTAEIPTSGKYHKPTSGNYGTWDNITKTAAATINMRQETANTKYSAVVIPTNYPKDLKFIYVTMSDGNKYAYTISDASGITLSAGSQYNFSISIGDDVATLQATYPTEWTASGFPITNYVTTERFGMYAVNSSGELVYANEPMTIASISGTTATLSAPASIAKKLSTSYNYYIYYPYRDTYTSSSVDKTKTDATDFFATIVSGWDPSTSQITTDALRGSDLQIGKITGDSRKTHTLTAATMAHKMGLVKINLKSATPYNNKYYLSTDNTYIWYSSETTTIYSSTSYSTTPTPYTTTANTTQHCIVKANTTAAKSFTFTTSKTKGSGTSTYASSDINDSWSKSISLSSGGSGTIDATCTGTYITSSSYTLALGDVFYSDGAVSKPNAKFTNKTAIGIVAYIGKDKYTEQNYGGGHALVLALSDESTTKRVFLPNSNWMYDTPGITNVYDLSTMKNATTGYENCFVYVTNLTSSNYPAFYYAVLNGNKPYPSPTGPGGKSTGWFLPSCCQWYRIIAAPGIGNVADANVTYDSFFDSGKTALTKINNALTAAGGTTIPIGALYWTSSDKETNGTDGVNLIFNNSGIKIGEGAGNYHSAECLVRSMIAF